MFANPYHTIRGELGTILRGGAVKGRAEPGIERFQVGKAIAQGNIGQSVLCQCQVVQGVLEAHTAQVFVEIHPHHLFEEGRNIGPVILSEIRQIFKGELFCVMLFDIGQKAADRGTSPLILWHFIQPLRFKFGTQHHQQQLKARPDRQLRIEAVLLHQSKDLAGIEPDLTIPFFCACSLIRKAGGEVVHAALFKEGADRRC